jgi:formylglycine-generating enzyme required for sulfatase activity
LTLEVILREPLGDRAFAAADFPVSIGGAGSTITVQAAAPGPLAWLGVQDEQLFLQPAEAGAGVLHNGARIDASTWVRSGDVLDIGSGRLKLTSEHGRTILNVTDGAAGNVTAPPLIAAATAVAGTGSGDEAIPALSFRRTDSVRAAERAGRLRGRTVMLTALAVLLGAGVYLFTSVPMRVESTPVAQDVSFGDGGPDLGFGASHLLRPGTYTLVVEHGGYATLRKTVTVTRTGSRHLTVQLQPLPGRLKIELPVTGTLKVAGQTVSKTAKVPGEVELPAGKYSLTIDTERYQDFATDVAIEGLGKRQTLAPKLVPGWSAVTVSSEPAGAQVLVAGEAKGVTPLTTELMGGNYRLELQRQGFKPWQSDIQVKANTPLAIGPVKLGVPDGQLVVRSSPAGANVTIGGVYRGRTPLDVAVRPDVPQAVAVSRDGYTAATREFSVGSGARQVVELALTPILGDVIVRARPSGAELFVDSVSKGSAEQTLRLPATAHVIEIRKQGYAPYRATVTPRPNLPQNIDVTLLEGVAATAASAPLANNPAGTAAAAAAAAAPAIIALTPTIRAHGGIDLKLVPAGSFTMGSPRREAGRRANESQRSVDLQRRFYVSLREITNAQFREFRGDHRSGFVGQTTLELERQPVVNVSWQDAATYCNWLSAQDGLTPAYEAKGGKLVAIAPLPNGYRLPTEAEWEWIARSGGGGLRKYPWGDSLPVPPGAGNYADRLAQPLVPQFLADYDDGYAVTAPVGSFGANPLGFFDIGGNVAEWTHDLYTVQPAGGAVSVDPVQGGEGGLHPIRGSSWKHSGVTELRLTFRDYGDNKRNDVGFRIARYAQ